MDPLNSLVTNVPDWLKRLDELNEQIEQRQLDLAKLAQNQPCSSARSLKNKGSTESLKPKENDGAALPSDSPKVDGPHDGPAATATPAAPATSMTTARAQEPAQQSAQQPADSPSSPVSDTRTPSAIQRQKKEVVAMAQRRARATLRKRQKSGSMVSAEGALPSYRSRSMIIVYYDSYVQSFFEELVKFVSASRNLMRKAKMAAKVAEIKRMAELEMPSDGDFRDSGELTPGDAMIAADTSLPSRPPGGGGIMDVHLRYTSSYQMTAGPRFGDMGPGSPAIGARPTGPATAAYSGSSLGLFKQDGDVYDELDKGLEFVQGMCERAAHQFLRDGECGEEIEKVKTRLSHTKEMADKEMARILKEHPNGLAPPEPPKVRSYRPMSMRRDPGASHRSHSHRKGKLEVDEDEGVQDMDGVKHADG